ncbi:MAG: hypothetical protein EA402_05405, partial [Planctomycetota bacterium]
LPLELPRALLNVQQSCGGRGLCALLETDTTLVLDTQPIDASPWPRLGVLVGELLARPPESEDCAALVIAHEYA